MEPEWLDRARELRAEAWDAVQTSPHFVAFKAFDDAVMRLGGTSLLIVDTLPIQSSIKRVVESAAKRVSEGRKVPHGDAAEIALTEIGHPLVMPKLLEKAIEYGAEIGGTDPLNNFRSSISKDDRFYSVKRGNIHYWWLKSLPLPPEGSSNSSFKQI